MALYHTAIENLMLLKSLFECRKVVTTSKSPEPGNEEYIRLHDNKYIGDLLAEFKSTKDRSKGEISQCKLTESDEAIADPMFVQPSYLQHDYILENYPVGKDDAAQLSALQILVQIGYVVKPETCTDRTTIFAKIYVQFANCYHDLLAQYYLTGRRKIAAS
ncbi:hypothetical protein M8C21_002379, partial [Ambrosia artemisiifolia]